MAVDASFRWVFNGTITPSPIAFNDRRKRIGRKERAERARPIPTPAVHRSEAPVSYGLPRGLHRQELPDTAARIEEKMRERLPTLP